MRIKELRLKKGITQNDLGKIIGVSGQTILNWENEIYHPDIEQLIKLADYFKVSVDYLINRKNTKENYINEIFLELNKISHEDFLNCIKDCLIKNIEDKNKN